MIQANGCTNPTSFISFNGGTVLEWMFAFAIGWIIWSWHEDQVRESYDEGYFEGSE